MRVTQQEAERVRKGLKTEHRFLVEEDKRVFQRRRRAGGRRGPLVAVPSESPAERAPWQPKLGASLSVQALGAESVPVVITGFRRELLGAADQKAARAEGHKTLDDLKTWWIARHDRDWAQREPDRHAWFHAPYGRPGVDRRLQALEEVIAGPIVRFNNRWADREVWVVTFAVEAPEHVRLLAPGGRGDDRGYSDTVIARAKRMDPRPFSPVSEIDEPEGVGDRWLARFAEGARVGEDHALRRELAEVTQGLLRARDHARRLGVDIDGEVHGIETRRDRIIAKLERQRPAA